MTYEEELAEQKAKHFALATRLDRFWNGFSGPDPTWDIPYPIPRRKGCWGRCYASRYNGTTYFGFAAHWARWRADANPAKNEFKLDDDHLWLDRQNMVLGADDVLAWLSEVERDPDRANRRIAEEFPKDERMGVVPRSIVERYIPDAYSIGKALGPAKSRAFVRIHASGYFHREENAQLEDMTANQFFEYCRIAYLAAERKDDHLDRTLTGREMYHRYADGRCGALLEIDPDSPDEFLAWLDPSRSTRKASRSGSMTPTTSATASSAGTSWGSSPSPNRCTGAGRSFRGTSMSPTSSTSPTSAAPGDSRFRSFRGDRFPSCCCDSAFPARSISPASPLGRRSGNGGPESSADSA